jgi:hypothetical protein
MKKIIILVFVLCINTLAAQTYYGNEWDIHAGAGSTIKDDSKAGFGGNLGINYTYFFSHDFGISLGAEAALYNSTLTLGEQNTEEQIAIPPGLEGNFFLRTHYSGGEERRTETFLQLPLMLRFQHPISSKNHIYLAAGAKYGIPLTASGKQTVGIVTVTGYSDYTEMTYRDMPERGFTTERNIRLSNKPPLKSIIMPGFEAGVKWNNRFFTGLYMDIGYSAGVKISVAFGKYELAKLLPIREDELIP